MKTFTSILAFQKEFDTGRKVQEAFRVTACGTVTPCCPSVCIY